jgi:hypothetical protein
MESKKINQLATNVAPQTSDLTIIGDPITGVSKKITLLQIADLFATTGTVTSVAVTETGDALTITGSPITSAGTINIGFAGDATQYVRGDGALADFPTSTGGGSSVSYYLNSSVSQGTIGGVAYRELSKDPISGAGTDITISANGYVASYITDANDPALLEVPGGNFNCEFYFSVNSNNHNPYVYAELYKYDGTTFTLLGSSQSVPEYLSNGTTLSPYYFAIPVATAVLSVTDRLAIRIYVNVDGRVVTLHTENNHLCQVVTTFSKGLTSLNNLTRQVQFLATGTSGTDFAISSSTATHTFNLPVASATNTGKLSSTDWSTFNAKQPAGNYVTLDTTQTITGDKVYSGVNTFDTYQTRFSAGIAINQTLSGGAVSSHTVIGANVNGLNVNFPAGGYNSLNFASTSAGNTYTFPNATGTIALTSQLTGGTVTSVGLSSATSGVTIGSSPITTSGTITLAIATASDSQNGLLSSTDWNTFNSKGSGTITSVTGTAPVVSSGGTTPAISMAAATTSVNGYLTSTDWNTFNNKISSQWTTISSNIYFANSVMIGSTSAPLSPLQVVATGTIVRLGEQSGTTGKQFLIGIDATSGRTELQSVWQGTSNTPLGLNVAGGNVLIGTTTDNGAKLQVSGTATFSNQVYVNYANPVVRFKGATLDGYIINSADKLYIADYNTATKNIVLDLATGNVGFGTSSPLSFTSYTTAQISNTAGGGLFVESTTGSLIGQLIADNGFAGGAAVLLGARSNHPVVFTTNNSEKMRITSDGQVQIKQAGNTFSDGFRLINTSTNTWGLVNGGDDFLYFGWNSNSKAKIDWASGTYTALSDINKKKDFEESTIGLSAILCLKPTLYRMIEEDDTTNKRLGFIAQDVKDFIPQAYNESKNGKETFIGLTEMPIIAALVKAIQELEARIKQLENK